MRTSIKINPADSQAIWIPLKRFFFFNHAIRATKKEITFDMFACFQISVSVQHNQWHTMPIREKNDRKSVNRTKLRTHMFWWYLLQKFRTGCAHNFHYSL